MLAKLSSGEIVGVFLAAMVLAAAAWVGIRIWKRSHVSPEELERRRRATLHASGKIGDATLVEVRGNLIFYAYNVRGVDHTASQDVSALRALLPPDPLALHGVVYIKYDARNPANSMILSEEWNGLRSLRAVQ
jgi:hypothetical protein